MPSLAALLIQIAVILLAARSVGALLRRLGQPQVSWPALSSFRFEERVHRHLR
jgi:hypothetical protein